MIFVFEDTVYNSVLIFFFISNQLYLGRLWSYSILLLLALSIEHTDGQGDGCPANRDCSHQAYSILLNRNVNTHAWILLWTTPCPSYSQKTGAWHYVGVSRIKIHSNSNNDIKENLKWCKYTYTYIYLLIKKIKYIWKIAKFSSSHFLLRDSL